MKHSITCQLTAWVADLTVEDVHDHGSVEDCPDPPARQF